MSFCENNNKLFAIYLFFNAESSKAMTASIVLNLSINSLWVSIDFNSKETTIYRGLKSLILLEGLVFTPSNIRQKIQKYTILL